MLKIKAKLGELLPAGKGGPGNADGQTVGINKSTVTAYRKLAANAELLDEYANATDDVPTQGEVDVEIRRPVEGWN